jgi:hypothetical protein
MKHEQNEALGWGVVLITLIMLTLYNLGNEKKESEINYERESFATFDDSDSIELITYDDRHI